MPKLHVACLVCAYKSDPAFHFCDKLPTHIDAYTSISLRPALLESERFDNSLRAGIEVDIEITLTRVT